jgi:hypothetical protein
MFQTIILVLLFIAAVVYAGRLLVNPFRRKEDGCATGCGKCSAVDLDTIEKQLKQKGF